MYVCMCGSGFLETGQTHLFSHLRLTSLTSFTFSEKPRMYVCVRTPAQLRIYVCMYVGAVFWKLAKLTFFLTSALPRSPHSLFPKTHVCMYVGAFQRNCPLAYVCMCGSGFPSYPSTRTKPTNSQRTARLLVPETLNHEPQTALLSTNANSVCADTFYSWCLL